MPRPKHEQTAAEIESENEIQSGRPPIHEQHPLSAQEQRQIDEALQRSMNVGRDR